MYVRVTPLILHRKVRLLVMRCTTQRVKSVIKCIMWCWRNFPKLQINKEINGMMSYDIMAMSGYLIRKPVL